MKNISVELRSNAAISAKNPGLAGVISVDISPGLSEISPDISMPAVGFCDTGISEVMGMMGAEYGGISLLKIISDMRKLSNDLR